MKIVTTTSVFPRGYPAEKALERLASLGFEALDMALDYWTYGKDSPFLGERYLQWASALREMSGRLGVPYTHAHAPGSTVDNPLIGRSIETASVLGVRYMVIHPEYNDADGRTIDDPEGFIKLNTEAVRPWLEMAEKRGVILLSENLLEGASSDPRVIAELVKSVDSGYFGWCFDTGHANCFGYGPRILTECAAVPLSLHVQDNDGSGDDHLIPGDGNIDWGAFAKTLNDAGYTGDCVLEAHHQSVKAPDSERDAVLSRLLERARKLRAIILSNTDG